MAGPIVDLSYQAQIAAGESLIYSFMLTFPDGVTPLPGVYLNSMKLSIINTANYSISSMSWSSTGGGQILVTTSIPIILSVNDVIVISGATNTGSGGSSVVNGSFIVSSITNFQQFFVTATASPGVIGIIGGPASFKRIVNGVNQTNVLNTNRGVVDGMGNVIITLSAPGDTMLLSSASIGEVRALVLDWTYNGGLSVGRREVKFTVLALDGL